jgi:hypothetical protein
LGHIIQRVSAQESHHQDPRGGRYQKRIAQVGSQLDLEDEANIVLAEWTTNKKPLSCPWVKEHEEV